MLGRMTIEVYDSVVPKTTSNFKMLCQQRSDGLDYSGTQIFRIVPGLFCLAGDVEYSIGLGGLSATKGERYFNDENYALSHNAPGIKGTYYRFPLKITLPFFTKLEIIGLYMGCQMNGVIQKATIPHMFYLEIIQVLEKY